MNNTNQNCCGKDSYMWLLISKKLFYTFSKTQDILFWHCASVFKNMTDFWKFAKKKTNWYHIENTYVKLSFLCKHSVSLFPGLLNFHVWFINQSRQNIYCGFKYFILNNSMKAIYCDGSPSAHRVLFCAVKQRYTNYL